MNQRSKEIKAARPSGFWVFAACLVLLATVTWTICVAWSVRRALLNGPQADAILSARQKAAVMAIAEFPAVTQASLQHVVGRSPLFLSRSEMERPSWVRRFPSPEDSGYLLFSGLYKNETSSSVKLIRIADGKIIASWMPDWASVLAKTTRKVFDFKVDPSNAVAINPVLLDDADIVFATGNASVRLPACGREPLWVLNETMHHSTDLDVDRTSFWTPSVSQNKFWANEPPQSLTRIDAIARVSLDGKLLERRSFGDISTDNELNFLLSNGNTAGDFTSDPVHMNQIRVAPGNSKFWEKGDLLISLRSSNAVLLYRPSTRKVVWHQVGPWQHQHSADFVNDHQISIFNNNVVNKSPATADFLTPQSTNEVMVFDFETNQITQPFKQLLETAQPRTVWEGRARLLPDGGLFLEETESGRILRFTKDKLLWSFINDHDDNHIGILAWSSYLTAEEARKPLEALAARRCIAGTPAANANAASLHG